VSDRWSKGSRVVHALSGVMVVGLVVVGFVMSDLDAASPVRVWLARGHTVGGVSLLLLTLGRLWLRRTGKPSEPLDLPPLHRRGLGLVHGAIYVTVFVLGLTGLATARTSSHWHEYLLGEIAGAPDMANVAARGVHETLVLVLLGLVGLHVVGVVVNEVRHGKTLRRMLPFFP